MPAQTGKSKLAADKDFVASFQAHKDDPVETSSAGVVPPGIEDGIAQVVDCEIGEFKKGKNVGKPYFRCAAVVVQPEEFNGVKVKGRRIQFGPLELCDTTDWQQNPVGKVDQYNRMMNFLKALGVTGDGLHPNNIETSMAAVIKAGICTRFRSWQGSKSEQFPNPKVKYDWLGSVTHNGEATSPVDDQTGETPSEEPPAEEPPEVEVDLEEMATAADSGDRDAQVKLKEVAVEAGVTEEEFEAADNFAAVAALIAEKQGGGEPTEPEEPWVPQKGEACLYRPIDKKTKKPVEKAVQVEITAINAKKSTATLLLSKDKKTTYADVPFSALEHG